MEMQETQNMFVCTKYIQFAHELETAQAQTVINEQGIEMIK